MASISSTVMSKSKDESIAISMDFADAIGNLSISGILSMEPLYRDRTMATDISIVDPTTSGTTVQCIINGGTYNYTYVISSLIKTTDGQIFEGRGLLTVE
jgi:hypothetical protein